MLHAAHGQENVSLILDDLEGVREMEACSHRFFACSQEQVVQKKFFAVDMEDLMYFGVVGCTVECPHSRY